MAGDLPGLTGSLVVAPLPLPGASLIGRCLGLSSEYEFLYRLLAYKSLLA